EASASIEGSQSKIILVKDSKNSVSSTARATVHAKQCPMSSSSASGECTEAEKAACKAAMAKGSTRMDCCKDKAKTVKAEKKSQNQISDPFRRNEFPTNDLKESAEFIRDSGGKSVRAFHADFFESHPRRGECSDRGTAGNRDGFV